jgi:hypothetical protein
MALIKAAKGKDWKLTIAVELTTRNTPQQNSKAEMAFTVIPAQARSMLIAAQVPYLQRFKLWPEVVMTMTFLNNLVPVIMNEERKTRWEHAGHKLPAWVKNLQTLWRSRHCKRKKERQSIRQGGHYDVCWVQ